MHLLIPFAAPPADAGDTGWDLPDLPQLAGLLARWTGPQTLAGDATALTPPHERVLAAAWGWPEPEDGLLALAAAMAAADGLRVDASGPGWALLSPTHWRTTVDQVSLLDPQALALEEAESRALFDALAALFVDDGWPLHWGAPTRWYTAHEGLARLPTASLDRVAGRSVQPWLRRHPEARALHRLQAEAQMLLHAHPVNREREARGLPPVNSFWVSGTGPTRPLEDARQREVHVDTSLRAPALAGDAQAWAQAWRRLDDGPLRALRADAGGAARLTLCGEAAAATWHAAPRQGLRRWFGARRIDVAALLATL